MVTKIQVFEELYPKVLAEQINLFNEEFDGFSTQIFPPKEGEVTSRWVAFVYYKSTIRKEKTLVEGSAPARPSSKGFIPATEVQLDYIYKNHLNVDTKNLSKKEAWQIISEHKKVRRK